MGANVWKPAAREPHSRRLLTSIDHARVYSPAEPTRVMADSSTSGAHTAPTTATLDAVVAMLATESASLKALSAEELARKLEMLMGGHRADARALVPKLFFNAVIPVDLVCVLARHITPRHTRALPLAIRAQRCPRTPPHRARGLSGCVCVRTSHTG